MLRTFGSGVGRTSGRPTTFTVVVALVALLLPTLLPSSRADAAAGTNPVVEENKLPGTGQWQLNKPADDTQKQIKGYASATSVNLGETIDFFVTVNPPQPYTVDIYRVGYYQGLGGRLVQHVAPAPGVSQPACPMDAATGMISCDWSLSYRLAVPTSWTSGIFLAKLTSNNGFQNYIIFTVRDDARHSDLLYQQSVSTYQAYNNYPDDSPAGSSVPATGKSLYDFNSSAPKTSLNTQRAVKVSYDRPYRADGSGHFLSFEVYFVRWMEQNGYDTSYSTNLDTDLSGARLRDHRGFLSVGHDEYWSKAMFDAVAAARDNGVGLGFFSGNSVYWNVRFEPSAGGRPDRVQVCYKDANLDPIKDTTTTMRWRDGQVNRPEQQLMGGMTIGQLQEGPPADYVVTNSSHWVYAGTGLRDGDKVPGIVGYEADRYINGQTAPVVAASTYYTVSSSPFTTTQGTGEFQQSTIYQAPSGAWVFGAGTIEWAWGLYNDGTQRYADPRIQLMTANLLNRFAAGPLALPPAVTGFTAVPSGSRVNLSWNGHAAGVEGYVLDRATSATFDASTSVTLPATATTYEDSGLAPAAYYYRIRAVNGNGNSPFTLASAATTAYTTLVNQRGTLLANWRLGENGGTTAWDTTGTYNGAYGGSVALAQPGALANDSDTAVGFSSATTKVTPPPLPATVDFTLEGWTYVTSTAANHTMYGGNSTVRILARPGAPNSTTTAYAGVWLNGTEYVLQPAVPGANLNTWVHWALTRDGNTLTFYRNGAMIGQRSDLPATAAANLSGNIGVQIGGAYPLSGRIDEVAAYRSALSSDEVADDFTAGRNGITPEPAPQATTSYRDSVLSESSLASYWRLGEASGTAAADAEGTATGTYVNGVALGTAGAVANDPNTAATFNGTNQRVSLPGLPSATDFSIEGWTNLSNPSSVNNTVYGTNANVRLMPRPGNTATPSAAYAGVWLNGTEYVLQPATSPAPNLNTWVHWVLTRQGNALTLYRNAAQIAQRTDLPATATANVSGFIGAQGGSAFFLAGSIDEVAVYRSALGPAAITKHYRAALYGPAPG